MAAVPEFDGEDRELDTKDEYVADADICSKSEISDAFPLRYHVRRKTQLSESFQDSNTYVQLVVDANERILAAANKKGEITHIDAASGAKKYSHIAHSEEISGLKFCHVNHNLLYSCSMDHTIKVWDLRSNNSEQTYQYTNEEGNLMEFTSLDTNSSGEFLCAGTTVMNDENAYLMFWDTRNSHKSLGGYSEGHSDDITHVKFHPIKSQQLASGAMDNLINVYDISKKSESNAFSHCIDFGTTPDCIHWDSHTYHPTKLFAVNYPQLVQYWDIDNTKPTADLTAKRLCKAIKRHRPEQCHFISFNYDRDQNPLLMLSSNLGYESQKNACIRTVMYSREKKRVKPHAIFELKSDKVIQVFDSVFLPSSEVFVTLESGGLRYWGTQGDKRIHSNGDCDTSTAKSSKKIKH